MPNNTSTSTAPFLPTLRPPSPSFSPSISLPPKPTFPTLPRGTSRSLLHRLRSIHTDSQFLTTVISALHPPLPVLVNKRAGEWYLDPKERQGAVYFKSTDGHYGNWGFSTRRLNLAVLEVTGGDVRGAIIVDSTRRGKRYPDSLSKTIPIWCAVINALLFPDFPSTYHQVFTPPRAVSKQETAHINSLMPTFVQQFMELNLDLKKQIKCLPKKPLRPYFVTPDDFFLHEQEEGESLIFEDYIPLVLVSVSRVVRNDGIEGEYIQGAGDDAENWLKDVNLTPKLFWDNHELLFSAHNDDELIMLVKQCIARDSISHTSCGGTGYSNSDIHSSSIGTIFISPDRTLAICHPSSQYSGRWLLEQGGENFDVVIDVRRRPSLSDVARGGKEEGREGGSFMAPPEAAAEPKPSQLIPIKDENVEQNAKDEGISTSPAKSAGAGKGETRDDQRRSQQGSFSSASTILHPLFEVPVPMGKKAARVLRESVLPKLRQWITDWLSMRQESTKRILIVSDEPGDTGVAVALFVLGLLYDEQGHQLSHYLSSSSSSNNNRPPIDKPYLRRRLAWIMSTLGEHASVSRANLIAVNSVLMS